MDLLPVVLSGGSGTRLWPISREKYPKQLLPLVGDLSMLQETISRLDGIQGLLEPLVVCNEEHRFVVAEQTRLLGKRATVVLEPFGRNTAPALTLAALWDPRQCGSGVDRHACRSRDRAWRQFPRVRHAGGPVGH